MPTNSAPQDNPPSALRHVARSFLAVTRDYFVTVRGGSEGSGFKTLGQLLRSGPLSWAGLGLLLLSVVATAYLIVQGPHLPTLSVELWDGQTVAPPLLALYLTLAVLSCAWAYLLIGAGGVGLGLYVVVASYVAWYGWLITPVMVGTIWLALIPLWLLVYGAWVAAAHPTRWRIPLLSLLSLVAAIFTYKMLLVRLLPLTPGIVVLGLVYAALVANPWVHRLLQRWPLKPALALVISLSLFILYYALGLSRSTPQEAMQRTLWDFYDLLGLVGLFWYWLGLDLFNGAHNLADWLVNATRVLLPERLLRGVILTLWLLWCLAAYFLAFTLPDAILRWLMGSPAGMSLARAYGSIRISDTLAWTLQYHLYLTLGIMLIALFLLVWHRLSHTRLMALFGLSLFAFFALFGYYGMFAAMGASDSTEVLGLWPAIIFVGGLFWQMLMVSSDLISGSKARTLLFLGFLLAVGAISMLEFAAGYSAYSLELSLNALSGVLFLGVPYVLYAELARWRHLEHIPTRRLLLLLALGMASALPCLLLQSLLPAPLLWGVILYMTAWRKWPWVRPLDGIVYGLALALGFVAFYTHRLWISIPAFVGFLGQLVDLQAKWEIAWLYPWQWQWWWILLQASAAALLLGYFVWRARQATRRRRWLYLGLAVVLSTILLVVCSVILN